MNQLLTPIPDPLDWPTEEYDQEHPVAVPIEARWMDENEPLPPRPYMPKERIHLVKRTLGYPYVLWVPDTVHWVSGGEEREAPYHKFNTEPMRTKIIQMTGAQPKPPASVHPSVSISIGDYFGTTFYLTLKTTIHWWTITGWVEASEVAEFDLLHYS